MAELHLARLSGLEGFEKQVAIKRILPALSEDSYVVGMFLDEARLAALLGHPNIVEVYDIGCADGLYYFAMEYVHGVDLRRVIGASIKRFGAVPIAEAVGIAVGVASGLHHAHERRDYQGRPLGVVHRDVSPSNILVRYDGCVKLVDFGIAKATSQLATTQVGLLKGKFSYMSPEQVRGQGIDRRSDIFALGIVLWEMTTGRRLFRADDDMATLEKVRFGNVPPPSRVVRNYPVELEPIVMRALARDREQRHATADELLWELEAFAREYRLATSPARLERLMAQLFSNEARRAGETTPIVLDPEVRDTVIEADPRGDDRKNAESIPILIVEELTTRPVPVDAPPPTTPNELWDPLARRPQRMRHVAIALLVTLLVATATLFAMMSGWRSRPRQPPSPTSRP